MTRLIWTSLAAFIFVACDRSQPPTEISTPDAAITAATVTKKDLGTLGGTNSYATGINDNGQIVRHSDLSSGQLRAFIWKAGQFTSLPNLPGSTTGVANAININGQVAGYVRVTQTSNHAALWQGQTVRDLGTLGGPSSFAYAINDGSQIVGTADINQYQSEAFLRQNGRMTAFPTWGI
jgi:probable HAF family extracellular repeat protein